MTQKYARLVQLAAWAATFTASFLIMIKLLAWWYTDSMSLLASVTDSFIDLLASVINLLVVRYSLQPADEEHRFGHGKAESLAALTQAAFVFGSAGFLVLNGIERLLRPAEIYQPQVGMIISAVAAVITLALVILQKWVVRKTGSQAIAADSLHYQTDLFMNIAIIVALALTWQGFARADAIFAIFIGVGIVISAYGMAQQAIQSLLDKQLPAQEQEKILQIVTGVAGVHGVHNLRTRRAGPTRFIQLHLELDDNISLLDAHTISDQVENLLCVVFPLADITLHQEPLSVAHEHRLEPHTNR